VTTAELTGRRPFLRVALDYVLVLKPRETGLLAFIGVCSALVAAGGFPDVGPFVLAVMAVTLGSAGCNGVTNYLDMRVDAMMRRTCSRVLPSRRIDPPGKVLPLVISLIVAGLALAWLASPWCFVVGVVGSAASVAWRKTITCTYFGIVASVSPVLIGWLAMRPLVSLDLVLLCVLIAAWVPLHVWTVMIANRSDYENAGLRYFPLTWRDGRIKKVLVAISVCLVAASLALKWVHGFGWLYLLMAVVMGLLMVMANVRLLRSSGSKAGWQAYKLSAFPYLGVMFMAMVIDVWLR